MSERNSRRCPVSRPEVGDKVRVRMGIYEDSHWVNATVDLHMSTQFTAVTPSGETVYALYNAEGEGWKRSW